MNHKIESTFLVLHCMVTEGRLMKGDTLPLHTNTLASRNAQYLWVTTKALEAARQQLCESNSKTVKLLNDKLKICNNVLKQWNNKIHLSMK